MTNKTRRDLAHTISSATLHLEDAIFAINRDLQANQNAAWSWLAVASSPPARSLPARVRSLLFLLSILTRRVSSPLLDSFQRARERASKMDAQQLTSRLLAHVASEKSDQTRSGYARETGLLDQHPSLARDLKKATAEAHEIVERHPSVESVLIQPTLHAC